MYMFYNVTEYRRLRNSCGGLPGPGWVLRLAFALSTILDKIIEFVKSSFGSNFMSEQRFDCAPPVVRLTQMRSRFLACLNERPHEIDMSRLGQNSLYIYWKPLSCVLHTVVQRRHVSFGRSLRQTQNPSDAFCVRRTTGGSLSKLERTEIMKGAKWRFSANS